MKHQLGASLLLLSFCWPLRLSLLSSPKSLSKWFNLSSVRWLESKNVKEQSVWRLFVIKLDALHIRQQFAGLTLIALIGKIPLVEIGINKNNMLFYHQHLLESLWMPYSLQSITTWTSQSKSRFQLQFKLFWSNSLFSFCFPLSLRSIIAFSSRPPSTSFLFNSFVSLSFVSLQRGRTIVHANLPSSRPVRCHLFSHYIELYHFWWKSKLLPRWVHSASSHPPPLHLTTVATKKQGAALIIIYALLVAAFWFVPNSDAQGSTSSSSSSSTW